MRYLKYLRVDLKGFAATCDRIDASDALPSPLKSEASTGGDSSSRQREGEVVSAAAGLRLVDYASSDESEPEDMDMDAQEDAGASRCEDSGFSASKVEMKQPLVPECELPHSKQTLGEPEPAQDSRVEGSSLHKVHRVQTSGPSGTCETSAMLCLSQLRELVTRLQAKKLFPYNPSSLLKLLALPLNK